MIFGTLETECNSASPLYKGGPQGGKSKAIRATAGAILTCASIAPIITGGDARVEIAAAAVIDAASDSFAQTVSEYHDEITVNDRRRERQAIVAFARRIQADPEDQQIVDEHTASFDAALQQLRADERIEWIRYTTAWRNVETLRSVASDLRALAVESLSLEDDFKRYLGDALAQLQEYRNKQDESIEPVQP